MINNRLYLLQSFVLTAFLTIAFPRFRRRPCIKPVPRTYREPCRPQWRAENAAATGAAARWPAWPAPREGRAVSREEARLSDSRPPAWQRWLRVASAPDTGREVERAGCPERAERAKNG